MVVSLYPYEFVHYLGCFNQFEIRVLHLCVNIRGKKHEYNTKVWTESRSVQGVILAKKVCFFFRWFTSRIKKYGTHPMCSVGYWLSVGDRWLANSQSVVVHSLIRLIPSDYHWLYSNCLSSVSLRKQETQNNECKQWIVLRQWLVNLSLHRVITARFTVENISGSSMSNEPIAFHEKITFIEDWSHWLC